MSESTFLPIVYTHTARMPCTMVSSLTLISFLWPLLLDYYKLLWEESTLLLVYVSVLFTLLWA